MEDFGDFLDFLVFVDGFITEMRGVGHFEGAL
jgi:hypothetical protein